MHVFISYNSPVFLVIADVVSNFAITVVLSGRTKKQRVLARSGQKTIFGWRRESWTRLTMMTTRTMTTTMTTTTLEVGVDYCDAY